MHAVCPLCADSLSSFVTVAIGRKTGRRPLAFLECATCGLVVRDPDAWPDRESERAHYRLHQNDANDPHYCRFLAPGIERLKPVLGVGVAGLDFGCGPDSAIVAVGRQAGATMLGYDPLFAPDERLLRYSTYDVVTCTETVEHLHRPWSVFQQMGRLLRPGGRLMIQTGFAPPAAQFADWHYWRDPTHVIFFRVQTFQWLAAAFGWVIVEIAAPVAVFDMPRAAH